MTNDGTLRRVKLAFERNYTPVPNDWARDSQNLSLEAIGLLVQLLSHNEGFTVSIRSLAQQNHVGKDLVSRIVRELRAGGYLELETLRSPHGRIEGTVWRLTDPAEVERLKASQPPLAGWPGPAEPYPAQPDPANPPLKEEQVKEHLTQVNKADHSTRAGMNEDASGDFLQDATIDPLELYQRSLHAPCKFFARGNRECDWSASGYCNNCARDLPSMLSNEVYG